MQAINYVNKIKNRFIKEPDTYKTFLEILQTYQKETRPIQEVYSQVTTLFHSAPDLLDEFKAFLPDTSAEGQAAAAQAGYPPAPTPPAGQPPSVGGSAKKQPVAVKALLGGKKVDDKKKRAAPGMGERAKAKRAKTGHAPSLAESPPPQASHSRERHPTEVVNEAVPYHPDPYGAAPAGFPGAPRMQTAYDTYLAHHRNPTLVVAEEFAFFDKVKRHLDDRLHYTEFLKLLNLFTQEIIDLPTLLEKALNFIGTSDELTQQFKDLVGWDPVKDGRIAGEDWIIDNEPALERPLVNLLAQKPYGPSYRKLPEAEVDLACSGRDALEWSVLNDHWVACATWGSEGSSAHRKNIFEEALFNSEQERHWYSFHLESLLRTINHFEPIAARIQQMTAEEKLSFKLDHLGGTAPSVYDRIVKKVYGKDHGREILEALCDNPAVAVPIVLSRLKQKDEEWKRAEKEWNKVWREVDSKNFYKALDHASIPFKAADKKQTTTSKSLTNDVETLRKERRQRREDVNLAEEPIRPLHQIELGMGDTEIMFDVLKLCLSFLDRDQSGFSGPERARLERSLRRFVPLMFNIPQAEMEAQLGKSDDLAALDSDSDEDDSELDPTTDQDAEGDEDGSGGNSPTTNGRKAVNRKGGAADLRKRLLTHAATAAKKGSRSRANSPEDVPPTPPGMLLGELTWIRLTDLNEGAGPAEPEEKRRFNFFANSPFYCFVRIFHTIYHRLAAFKDLARLLAEQPAHQRLNPLAVDLGLATPMSIIDDLDHNPAGQYYPHLLELAEKLFDGEIDQQTYEEQLRYMAGIKAYPLFTLDKLINAVVKHVHTINSDGKCQDLVGLLEKDRAREFTTPRQQIAYRMEAEGAIGVDDALYRIEWIPNVRTISVQLLGKEDLTLDDAHQSARRLHSSWVASYALPSATEGVGAQVTAPVLKRNRVLAGAEEAPEVELLPGLEARVSGDSYQLLFVAGTEDFLFRPRPEEDGKATELEPEPEAAPVPAVVVDADVLAGVEAMVEQVEAAKEEEAKAAETAKGEAAPAGEEEPKPAEEVGAGAQAEAKPTSDGEGEGNKEKEAAPESSEKTNEQEKTEEKGIEGEEEVEAEMEAEVEVEAEAEAEAEVEVEVEAEDEVEVEAEEEDVEDVKETYEEVKQRRKERFARWLEGAAARAEEAAAGFPAGEPNEEAMEF